MRFRTKLFLVWALTVLIPLAAIAWPLTQALRESFEHGAEASFAGTNQSLAGVQAARESQMRQAGVLVMSIPELRALIAESSIELTQSDLQSLQERLDYLAGQMDVRFLCVLDGRGALVAQNHHSPWESLASLQRYASQSAQPQALLRRLYAARQAGPTETACEEGLWVYEDCIYEVVGIPLVFGEAQPGAAARIDGALIVAVPLSDQIAQDLGKRHDCQISFLADGRATASSLPAAGRAELEEAYRKTDWPQGITFNVALRGENYLSSLKPLTDAASGTQVGAMLIQTSTAAAESTQRRVLTGLAATVLLALVGALGASFLLSGVIVRPVRTLVQGARKVAGGDLETTLPVQRGDELGQLTVAFNDMVKGLRRQKELQTLVEESQAASKAKSRFLANMSHEIRTPLHGVIGMAELLMRTEMSERQRRYVGLLKSSAELLTRLINDVLDFSKADAGKLELEVVDFDLRQLIEDATELMGQRAQSKRLQLTTEFSADVPAAVRGDPTRLRQILLNLLSNALKFTDAGKITLRVVCTGGRAGGSETALFKFEVQDTGIGIPKDRMGRLFQSFSQVDASTTRRFGGTGLGLAICKQLAELMGGQIGVESVEGKGSTFWFTARLQCVGEAPTPAAAPEAGRPNSTEGGKYRDIQCLLVEDQEINCIVASELLTEAGLMHDIVHDGKSAVDAVLNGKYHLVLMDCQMPGMDGMEATRRIRSQERENPGRGRAAIIALTANTSGADRAECVAAGMDGFCSKPFTTKELFDAIGAALGDRLKGPVAAATTSAGAAPAAEGVPAFDVQTVLQRCSGKPSLASLILDKFQAQATEALGRIEATIAAGDAVELTRAAHGVKGTAGLLGAKPLHAAAARLEALGRAQNLELAQAAVAEMRRELDRCVKQIQETKAGMTMPAEAKESEHGHTDRR